MNLPKGKRTHRNKTNQIGNVTIGLRNLTRFSDEEIWQAVEYTITPLQLEQHPYIELDVVELKPNHSWPHSGYYRYPAKKKSKKPHRVRARVKTNDDFYPHLHLAYADGKPRKWGYQQELLLDKTENLIAILAHEFKHAWQREHRNEPNDRPYGVRRDAYDETQADAYAKERVRTWRRLYNHKEAYPPLFFAMFALTTFSSLA